MYTAQVVRIDVVASPSSLKRYGKLHAKFLEGCNLYVCAGVEAWRRYTNGPTRQKFGSTYLNLSITFREMCHEHNLMLMLIPAS